MIVTELIREQSFQWLVMTAAGAGVMILYQMFGGTCRLLGMGNIPRSIAEVFFWLAAAVISWQFLYYCAYGRLSFHAAAAFTAGALLWKKFFYDIIDKIYTTIYKKQGIRNENGEKEKKQPVQGHQSGDRH